MLLEYSNRACATGFWICLEMQVLPIYTKNILLYQNRWPQWSHDTIKRFEDYLSENQSSERTGSSDKHYRAFSVSRPPKCSSKVHDKSCAHSSTIRLKTTERRNKIVPLTNCIQSAATRKLQDWTIAPPVLDLPYTGGYFTLATDSDSVSFRVCSMPGVPKQKNQTYWKFFTIPDHTWKALYDNLSQILHDDAVRVYLWPNLKEDRFIIQWNLHRLKWILRKVDAIASLAWRDIR